MDNLLIYKGTGVKRREDLRKGDMVRIIDGNDYRRGHKLVAKGTIGKIVETDFGDPPYVFKIRTGRYLSDTAYWYAMKQVEPVEE